MQTRIDALENNSPSSSGGHKRNDENSVRAVATGFTGSERWRKALKIHIPFYIKKIIMVEMDSSDSPADDNNDFGVFGNN